MGILSTMLTYVGYLLIYGAVADHGKFAAAPWAGIFADAYDTNPNQHGANKSNGSNTPPGAPPTPPTGAGSVPSIQGQAPPAPRSPITSGLNSIGSFVRNLFGGGGGNFAGTVSRTGGAEFGTTKVASGIGAKIAKAGADVVNFFGGLLP